MDLLEFIFEECALTQIKRFVKFNSQHSVGLTKITQKNKTSDTETHPDLRTIVLLHNKLQSFKKRTKSYNCKKKKSKDFSCFRFAGENLIESLKEHNKK